MTGWATYDQTKIKSGQIDTVPEVDCRETGFFAKHDLYCANESNYVWRCKNNDYCNHVKPFDDQPVWKMWESWELHNALPNRSHNLQ